MHRMLARPVAEEHLQSVTAKEVVFIKDSFGSLSYLPDVVQSWRSKLLQSDAAFEAAPTIHGPASPLSECFWFLPLDHAMYLLQ